MTTLTKLVLDEERATLPGLVFGPWVRRIAVALVALFVLFPVFLALAPWQQNIATAGRVIAFTPLDRPQPVEAPVSGRVVEVFVQEAQEVEKGDPLVRIVDIDPEKVARLDAQLLALRQDFKLTEQTVETFRSQASVLRTAGKLAVDAFQAKAEMANERRRAAEQKLLAATAERDFAKEREARLARLVPEFVEEMKLLSAQASLAKAEAALKAAEADVQAALAAERSAAAELGKEGEVANADVREIEAKQQQESAKLARLRAKIAGLEGELRAQNAQMVHAPRDGRVFRLRVNTDASIVKVGDVLLRIVPATSQPAVELFVRGVDAPLVQPGRIVRLQFEGWPAVQFVGWPSVAVGTFGGIVSIVDPTDSGDGKFRVLVVPDPGDEPWPGERWLRQGVRAKGWVLLDEVRVGYEMWRQLNGFPPVVEAGGPAKGADSNPRPAK